MYEYDCGAAGNDTDIEVVPKGGSMFEGRPLAATWGSSGSEVLERLSPGTYSLVVNIPGCHWRVVAGIGLNTDRLLTDVVPALLSRGTPSKTYVDTRVASGQEFGVNDVANSELIYAYDCGTQTSTGPTDPLFDLPYTNHDPGHEVSGSLVRFFSQKAWGVVVNHSSPFASVAGSQPGYVARPGTESVEVYPNACNWHVLVGENLQLMRP